MAAADGSGLLARLAAGEFANLAADITSFLQPFNPHLTPRRKPAAPALLRPLAKQYLPFLSPLLKHLAAALSSPSAATATTAADDIDALFAAYGLALDCLETLAPCIAAKPHSLHLLRIRRVRCLEACGRVAEAEQEGFAVLEGLKVVVAGVANPPKGKRGKKVEAGCYLPAPIAGDCDEELAFGVSETVVCLVTCVYKSESVDAAVYRRVLALVEQVDPWFSVLELKVKSKFQGALVSAMYKCALVMTANFDNFDENLMGQFCSVTLRRCADSSVNDQFFRMARKMCSSFDWKHGHRLILDVLRCCLELLVCQCKANLTSTANEGFDCLHYFMRKCRHTSDVFRKEVSKLLSSVEQDFSQLVWVPVIFNAHISGLLSLDFDIIDRLQSLAAFDPLKNLLCNGVTVLKKDPELCINTHERLTLSSYVCAFDLLCYSLSEVVNTTWKHVDTEQEVPFYSNINLVQDIFHHFCEAFLAGIKTASEVERERLNECFSTVLHVSMASFRVFLRTNNHFKKSIGLMNSIISSNWIGPQELKYLASGLYNIGVSFIDSKNFSKASLCLELCYSAVWTHILHQCRLFLRKINHISEETIKEYVSDACTKTALYLDALHECGSPDINNVIVDSLNNWAKVVDLLNVAGPDALVKQWVKIMCKVGENVDLGNELQSLSHFIPSSFNNEKKAVILEQELSAYRERESQNLDLCIKMQLKIIVILLQDVYTTSDNNLQKSILLLKRGRLLRASGIDGLKNCTECLSEAILLLKGEWNGSSKLNALVGHQLALTYCLRALCMQETCQASEAVLNDISCAMDLWSSTMTTNLTSGCHPLASVIDKAMPLLYHLADLLSMKGFLDYHFEIYKLIITIQKLNNISLETSLATLWFYRRLNHGLCVSPIDDGLLLKLSRQFGSQVVSLDFWMDCTVHAHPSSLLGFFQNFMVHNLKCMQGENYLKGSPSLGVSTNSLREVASALLASVPKLSHKAFVAGHLYYDLADKLISNGRLCEALSNAKEALLLRTRFLHKKFIYFDVTKVSEEVVDDKENQLRLEVSSLAATEAWPRSPQSRYLEQPVLSSWNVLKCYLESCFQVGIIHELMGNAVEAEAYLRMGNKLSCLHGLLFFRVSFGTILGRIYCRKRKLDFAEAELGTCRKLLHDCSMITSCIHCKLALDVSLDLNEGDLIRTRSTLASQVEQSKDIAFALNLYAEALKKIDLFEHDYVEPAECNIGTVSSQDVLGKQARKMRTTKGTRGKNHIYLKHPKNVDQNFMIREADVNFGTKREICLLDVINFKWEYRKRRLALYLLMKKGKCGNCISEIHDIHKNFRLVGLLLYSRHPIPQSSDFLEFIDEDIPDDIFSLERATFLYEISWLSLKLYVSRQLRKISCCNLSNIEMSTIMSWLLQAFVISRDCPLLFQKISKLLGTIFLLFGASGHSFLSVYCSDSLSFYHWAAFFHQASIGAHFYSQYSSANKGKNNSLASKDFPAASCVETLLPERLFPENVNDLSDYVNNFFIHLPSLVTICMSMIGGGYGDLIMELLHLPSSFPAWLLFTRFSGNKKPVVMLFPVDTLDEESEDKGESDFLTTCNETRKKWLCPWGHSLIDNVVPQFKSIMEENYLSSSDHGFVNTKENRILWWKRRNSLNDRLDRLLKNLEYLWLGPWRCLFQGEPLDDEHLGKHLEGLMVMLKDEHDCDVHEQLFKIILTGDLTPSEREECLSQFLSYRGYFGRGGSFGEKRCGLFSSFSVEIEDDCGLLRQPLLDAISEVEVKVIDRHPIILVMEANVQMLPWESLPVLRLQEVYRMPSVESIRLLLKQPISSEFSSTYPSVDPLNAYFLLNPSGDLGHTQLEFEEWFKSQKWEGKAGNSPTSDELAAALESRDLFLYFGHGSGNQYISGQKIQMLKRCAATLLMGCSSGSLHVNGIYAPLGAPIFYLMAGSPAILANLWDVTDRDIDRFGKFMVDAWLEASKENSVCDCCNSLINEMESLTVETKKVRNVVKTKRKAPKGKKTLESEVFSCKCKKSCKSASLASFMSSARDACTLPFLVGASPVCYGVPTRIARKNIVA